MTPARIVAILGVGLALACAPSLAEEVAPTCPGVSVLGSSEVRVAPDRAEFTLTVRTSGDSAEAARAGNDRALERAKGALRAHGVEDRDIRPGFLSVIPTGRSGSEAVKVYRASHTAEVTARDLARFEALLSAVLDVGATEVGDVRFVASRPREKEALARAEAIADARRKAEEIAGALGCQLGPVFSAHEVPSAAPGFEYIWSGLRMGGSGMAGLDEGPAAGVPVPGRIAIRAEIILCYVLLRGQAREAGQGDGGDKEAP